MSYHSSHSQSNKIAVTVSNECEFYVHQYGQITSKKAFYLHAPAPNAYSSFAATKSIDRKEECEK